MGAYRLQWDMIKFALNNNIPRYNFYGITGNFSENAEDYGVQQFKKVLTPMSKNTLEISSNLYALFLQGL